MKKEKKLIVGNWKMNPQDVDEAKKIATVVKKGMNKVAHTDVVLCPPFVFLESLSGIPKGNLFLGAQNANSEPVGSFTGEVSFSELYQFSVRFVILGHSERRKMGETDEVINKKVKAVIGGGMKAIVCVGESTRDTNGDYYAFIKHQITSTLKDVSKKSLGDIIVAYEPIWAIGAKEAMKPSDLHEMSIFIKKVLHDMYGVFSDDVKILYGGTADKINAYSLVKEGNVSGLLVGRESLRPGDFVEMIQSVDTI